MIRETRAETEARELLLLAARTVPVEPAGPLDSASCSPRRRRLVPVVLAAASVVVMAVLLSVLAGRSATAPSEPSSVVPAVTAPPPPVLADGRVPSVLGLTRSQAVELLEGQGADVEMHRVGGSCASDGWAVGTDPQVGSPLTPGAAVVLELPRAGSGTCGVPAGDDVLARRLVAFARGLAPAPSFAPTVTLRAGAAAQTLTASEAAELSRWSVCGERGCAFPLDDLARITTLPVMGEPVTLTVSTGPQPSCFAQAPGQEGRDVLHVGTVYPLDGDIGCISYDRVDVYLDDDDRIATVVTDPPPRPDPNEPTAQQQTLGTAFLDWSRGAGPAPAFADEVTLLRDDEVVDVLSASEAADPRAWPVDVPGALAAYEGQVALSTTPLTTCGRDTDDLPDTLRGRLDDLVRLDPPEVHSCAEEFAVELWSVDGRIDAADLVDTRRP